jgi:hypothetical protein
MLVISCDDNAADNQGDDLSELGGVEGKLQIRLKQTELSLKHFANKIGVGELQCVQ